MFLCYAYVLAIIVISGKMDKNLRVSRKSSRKFLRTIINRDKFMKDIEKEIAETLNYRRNEWNYKRLNVSIGVERHAAP